jgi:hypothetical protein
MRCTICKPVEVYVCYFLRSRPQTKKKWRLQHLTTYIAFWTVCHQLQACSVAAWGRFTDYQMSCVAAVLVLEHGWHGIFMWSAKLAHGHSPMGSACQLSGGSVEAILRHNIETSRWIGLAQVIIKTTTGSKYDSTSSFLRTWLLLCCTAKLADTTGFCLVSKISPTTPHINLLTLIKSIKYG